MTIIVDRCDHSMVKNNCCLFWNLITFLRKFKQSFLLGMFFPWFRYDGAWLWWFILHHGCLWIERCKSIRWESGDNVIVFLIKRERDLVVKVVLFFSPVMFTIRYSLRYVFVFFCSGSLFFIIRMGGLIWICILRMLNGWGRDGWFIDLEKHHIHWIYLGIPSSKLFTIIIIIVISWCFVRLFHLLIRLKFIMFIDTI